MNMELGKNYRVVSVGEHDGFYKCGLVGAVITPIEDGGELIEDFILSADFPETLDGVYYTGDFKTVDVSECENLIGFVDNEWVCFLEVELEEAD